MSEQGVAYFVKRPRRIEELLRPHLVEDERRYEVVKTIRLKKLDHENFITDMVADREFLSENAALCGADGEVIRCLKITCAAAPEKILVVPDGAWAAMAALAPGDS